MNMPFDQQKRKKTPKNPMSGNYGQAANMAKPKQAASFKKPAAKPVQQVAQQAAKDNQRQENQETPEYLILFDIIIC